MVANGCWRTKYNLQPQRNYKKYEKKISGAQGRVNPHLRDTRLAVSRQPHTFPGAADRRPHPVRRPHSRRPPRPAPPPAATALISAANRCPHAVWWRPAPTSAKTAALTGALDGRPHPRGRLQIIFFKFTSSAQPAKRLQQIFFKIFLNLPVATAKWLQKFAIYYASRKAVANIEGSCKFCNS